MAKLIYIWGTEWICIPGFNSHYTQKEHGTVTDEECNHSDEDPSLRWFPMFLRFVTVAISKAAEDNQNSIEKAVVFFFFTRFGSYSCPFMLSVMPNALHSCSCNVPWRRCYRTLILLFGPNKIYRTLLFFGFRFFCFFSQCWAECCVFYYSHLY